MTCIAIDASVLAKLFFDEDNTDLVKRSIARVEQMYAPDLILAEVGNVIWKRFTRREIDTNAAMAIVEQVVRFPVKLTSSAAVLADAAAIALACRCSVYDSLYLAVATRYSTTLVTADQRFARAIQATEWSPFVRLVGD